MTHCVSKNLKKTNKQINKQKQNNPLRNTVDSTRINHYKKQLLLNF